MLFHLGTGRGHRIKCYYNKVRYNSKETRVINQRQTKLDINPTRNFSNSSDGNRCELESMNPKDIVPIRLLLSKGRG